MPLLDGSQLFFLFACILSVPAAQLCGRYAKPQQSAVRPVWGPTQLVDGGVRHIVFTAMSWLTWSVSVAFAAPVVSPLAPVEVQPTHVGVLYGAAVACSVVGLVFNIKALLAFESSHCGPQKITRKRVLSRDTGFFTVCFLGLILALMSGLMLAATDHLPDVPSRLLYCILSICCAMIAASSTHGLGGYLYHTQRGSNVNGWKFFQPFEGGQIFVASQALGWTLFGIFIACVLKLMQEVWKGVGVALKSWTLGIGGMIVVTQLVLGFSLLTFRGRQGLMNQESNMFVRMNETLYIILLYMPIHLVISVWVVNFTLLPAPIATALWILCMGAYYGTTSAGNPGHTGCRKWPAVRSWFHRHAADSLKAWMGRVDLVYASDDKPDASQKFIFGYHPHGLYPCGAAALPLLPGFERLFPGLTPATLSASITFFAPLVRDLLSWCGVREVSRRTFIRALREEGGVILCPGGQEELAETYRVFREPSELVICSRHKGFCRIAIEEQSSLVPVLALGEIFTLKNAFDWPKLQMATYRIFGFPIPYLLVGRWGFSPLPRKVPLLFIIGKPITPPKVHSGSKVAEKDVDHLHEQYYKELVNMFHKYKDKHDHYNNTNVVLKQGPNKQ